MCKLYVITRTDIAPIHRTVQSGHAVAGYALKNFDGEWDNGTLVYLGIKNEDDLLDLAEWLHYNDKQYYIFHESHWDEHTSLAFAAEKCPFKGLKLLDLN